MATPPSPTAAATPDRRTSSEKTVDADTEQDGVLSGSLAKETEQPGAIQPLEGDEKPTEDQPPTAAADDEKPSDASAPPPADAPEASRTTLETFLIMLALCTALFLAALDMTIVTTAIPTISTHFKSSSGYVWIGSSYLLGNAAFVPTWGKISDIFGRKPVLLCAVAIFWVGSLLCAVSVNMAMLIAARAIQGVGAGGVIVLPNICISDLFSMRTRGMYFGLLGMVWALASAIGPVLGGVFTSQVSWRWCFYINLPLSGVGFIILIFVLKLHNPRTPMKEGLVAIDWVGSLLVIGGTLMILLGLEFGGVSYPWGSATVICLIVFGVIIIGLFIINEWKIANYPVIPVHIFKHRTSIAVYILAFTHAFTFMSGSYWLPLYFQGVLGASSLMSGVYILPYVLALSFISASVGIFIKKTGQYKLPICLGMGVMTLGFGLFIDLDTNRNWAKIIIFQIIAGIGVGPNFQAPLLALQTNVEPRDIGSATSSFSFLRQVGTSVSVAIGGVIFNNEMQKQQPMLQRELGPELAQQLSGSNAAGNVQLVGELRGHDGDVAHAAFENAMQTMYIVYTCFAFLGFLVSFFVKQVSLSKDHEEHKTGLKTLKGRKEREQEQQQLDEPPSEKLGGD